MKNGDGADVVAQVFGHVRRAKKPQRKPSAKVEQTRKVTDAFSALSRELNTAALPPLSAFVRTRGDCTELALGTAQNPCPHVRCKYHLAIEVSARTSNVVLVYGSDDPSDWVETCALHVCDLGGATLEQVGAAHNVTRERARQIESKAIARVVASMNASERQAFADYLQHFNERNGDDEPSSVTARGTGEGEG